MLQVKDLRTHFFLREGTVRAVDGVDFTLTRRSTIGIVGESGCGKSVMAYSILQLITKPGRIVSGNVFFDRSDNDTPDIVDLTSFKENSPQLRAVRGKDISLIFQEPMNSLSPVHTIGDQITEGMLLHTKMTKAEATKEAIDLLREVGIPKPEERINNYTFQLSGGMRQRAMIAAALACSPKLLIADEPTTALDVTTQAQILDLLKKLQEHFGMAIMLITHDLGVVAETCDEVVVMYLGEVVEQAAVDQLFHDPLHPYTQALLKSVPKLGYGRKQKLDPIRGSIPDPFSRPTGCPFHERCEKRIVGKCEVIHPKLTTLPDGRTVRCLLYEDQES
ncbi:MAG: ATP-binding cassette domain-containing protein [Anaerolineaceae bacterium]|nr:ATP-binding cassette domain-containing protein [Anaerolineaceae bacterium]